jgi:hypothetical protein
LSALRFRLKGDPINRFMPGQGGSTRLFDGCGAACFLAVS